MTNHGPYSAPIEFLDDISNTVRAKALEYNKLESNPSFVFLEIARILHENRDRMNLVYIC